MATKPKTAVALSPVEQIAELVEKRDLLTEQRGLVAAAPRAMAEASADVDHVVEQLAASVEVPASWLGQAGGVGELVHLLTRPDQQGYQPLTPAQLLAWADPDTLSRALRRDLQQAYQEMPKPMKSGNRLSELGKLDRELAAVEADLASTWWGAMDAGVSLDLPAGLSGAVLIGLAP